MHQLWLPSPAQLEIPFVCGELDQQAWLFPFWAPREPLTRLDQLPVPAPPAESVGGPGHLHRLDHPGQTVALATLIEYAAARYGRERLPALVAGLGHYESWDTLLPAVYGVSPTDFEAGWQAYLKAHYGVPSLSSGGVGVTSVYAADGDNAPPPCSNCKDGQTWSG
jgi:hypothetical protein